MRRKLKMLLFMLAVLAFITAVVYTMGIPGSILLIVLAVMIAYIRYVGNSLAKLIISSHEKLHKNDEVIFKRVKSLEVTRR